MGDTKSSVAGPGPTPTKQPTVEDRLGLIEKALTILSGGKKGKKKKQAREEAKGILMPGNLIAQIQGVRDELSRLITLKAEEVISEGELERPENVRKHSRLKSSYVLLTDAQNELNDMYG